MELRDLIRTLAVPEMTGIDSVEITGIQSDSRKVKSGNLFVAVRGTNVDGHAYIETACKQGAAAVVCETIPVLSDETRQQLQADPIFIQVKDSAAALGQLLLSLIHI